MSLIDRLVIWLMNELFGWHRYRVRFSYKNKRGDELLNTVSTVAVRDCWHIDCHRELKKANGPIWKHVEARPYLNNGTIDVEPLCYLGRWKDR